MPVGAPVRLEPVRADEVAVPVLSPVAPVRLVVPVLLAGVARAPVRPERPALRLAAVRFAGRRLAVVRLAAARFAGRRFAVVRFAAVRFAGRRLAVERLAVLRFAVERFAAVRFAGRRLAVERFAVVRFAAARFAGRRLAVERLAVLRFAVVRFAAARFAGRRLAVERLAVLRLAVLRLAVVRFAVLRFAVLRFAVLRFAGESLAVVRFVVLRPELRVPDLFCGVAICLLLREVRFRGNYQRGVCALPRTSFSGTGAVPSRFGVFAPPDNPSALDSSRVGRHHSRKLGRFLQPLYLRL
jgi:hypothetical protein